MAIAEHKKQVALEQKIERELIDEEFRNSLEASKSSKLKGIPVLYNVKPISEQDRKAKLALKLKESRPGMHSIFLFF